MAGPDGGLKDGFEEAGFAGFAFDFAEFGAGAAEVHFGADAGGPGFEEAFEGGDHGEAFGVEAPVVLVVEDAFDAGALVDGEDVGGGKADVVVFEDEAALDGFGEAGPGADPVGAAGGAVAVGTADVDDHDGLGAELHVVEHGGLGFEVGDGFLGEGFVAAVEDDELGGVEAEAEPLRAGEFADVAKVVAGFLDHGVELGHVGVGVVGGEVGGHAVHADVVLAAVGEDVAEIAEGDAEVGVLLPAAGVVGFEVGGTHDLDGEAEAHGFRREGRGGEAAGVGGWSGAEGHGVGEAAVGFGGGAFFLAIAGGLHAGAFFGGFFFGFEFVGAFLLSGGERLFAGGDGSPVFTCLLHAG